MWCRSDVRLWHYCYFIFWQKPFLRCHTDARLRHVFYFLPFEASLQTPDRSSSYFTGISGGLPPDFLFLISAMQFLIPVCVLWFLLMCIMIAFVISYVQTICEYIQSTHWLVPGYCFGQMWTKAILWMKSMIASSMPRGVPVSLLRSWSLSRVL